MQRRSDDQLNAGWNLQRRWAVYVDGASLMVLIVLLVVVGVMLLVVAMGSFAPSGCYG